MKKRFFGAFIVGALSLLLVGCVDFPKSSPMGFGGMPSATPEPNLVDISYGALDRLIEGQSIDPKISSRTLVLVSTIQNVDSINKSSTFGRLLSEQMSSRLAQIGVPVRELKLRGSLYVDSHGEQMLSREIRDISRTQKADLILAGTYGVAGKVVYVSLKLIRPEDSRITSAYDFSVPLTPNIKSLLGM